MTLAITGVPARLRRRCCLLAALAALLALAACEGDGENAPAVDAEEAEEHIAEADRLVREVEEAIGEADGSEQELIDRAEAWLVTDCVQDAGVDYEMPDPTALGWTHSPLEFPEGAEVWLAKRPTLGIADAVEDPATREELAEREDAPEPPPPPDGFDEVHRGDPPETISVETHDGATGEIHVGGCAGEAKRQLFGVEAEEYERTRLEVRQLAVLHQTVSAREEVAAAAQRWSACMRDEGFDLGSPDDLTVPLGQALVPVIERGEDTARLHELEEDLEVADRDCKEDSGLPGVYAAAYVEEAEAALADTEGALVAYRDMRAHATEVGENLIADEGP